MISNVQTGYFVLADCHRNDHLGHNWRTVRGIISGHPLKHYSTVCLTWSSIAHDSFPKLITASEADLPRLNRLSWATHVRHLSRHKAWWFKIQLSAYYVSDLLEKVTQLAAKTGHMQSLHPEYSKAISGIGKSWFMGTGIIEWRYSIFLDLSRLQVPPMAARPWPIKSHRITCN